MRYKTIIRGGLGLLLLFSMTGCQDLFTRSAFTWAAADPSDMSAAQLKTYAEGLVMSGDNEAMAEAYTALVDTLPDDAADDPDLYLLASDLAMGGSGLPDAITEAVSLLPDFETMDPTELENTISDLINGIDGTLLEGSVDLFTEVSALPGSADSITESQYTNAAVALLFVIYQDTPDPADITADPDFAQVEAWALAGGMDLDTFTDLLGA
jgi:hypothetical protein